MRAWLLALVVAVATPAFAQDATIDTIWYRVRDGDTLGLVAAEHYGDRKKAIFIMVENKLTHARPLKPGERIKIPVNREITTSPGDTFETLATTYLGDGRRGIFLAEFNNMSPEEQLPAGTPLQVPFTVSHTAANVESLANIGASYFNDKSQGEMLRRYNFLEKGTLEKGDSIIIPVYNVRLPVSKMPQADADSKQRRAARRESAARAATALPRAWQAWRSGEPKQIQTTLFDLDIDYLDAREAIDVSVLRGLAAASQGNKELAVEAFKQAVARNPSYVLRKFDYSPKILELWTQAGGSIE